MMSRAMVAPLQAWDPLARVPLGIAEKLRERRRARVIELKRPKKPRGRPRKLLSGFPEEQLQMALTILTELERTGLLPFDGTDQEFEMALIGALQQPGSLSSRNAAFKRVAASLSAAPGARKVSWTLIRNVANGKYRHRQKAHNQPG